MAKRKNILMLVIICVIPISLYYGVDTVTSLNIFPRNIKSGDKYTGFLDKYGVPQVLISTKMKLVEKGVSITPGENCRLNINTIIGPYRTAAIKKSRMLAAASAKDATGNDTKAGTKDGKTKESLSDDIGQGMDGMIDKIFSGYMGYVSRIEGEMGVDIEEYDPEQDIESVNQKKDQTHQLANPENIVDDSTSYRAEVYESKLLVSFKQNFIYRIVLLKEKFYKCSFPRKTQFYTYSIDSDDIFVYVKNGLKESQFEKMLNMKKSHNKFLAYFEKWKNRRTRTTFDNFYRLYKFTIPTSTTCMFLKDKNIILYGENIHKNDVLLQIVEKVIDKNMLKK